jgi:hypothetical protein
VSLLPLALALALTAQPAPPPPPPPADTAGTRLVIVTFERRAAAYFRTHPEEYGPFLGARRQEVLDLLFGPGEAGVRPGDYVALMADGADAGFPAATGLGAGSSPADVAARLRPMISLPGAPPGPGGRVWLRQVSDTVGRAETDAALRTLVTCPLAGYRGMCDEAAAPAPGATSGFSRPLLTFPVQYMLAADALRARAGVQPDRVHWIWVQVGERFNEINSLVPEIRRDFHPPEAARAVLAFRDSTLRALEFRFVSETAAPGGGGVTVWEIASAGLHALARPDAAPLAFRDARTGAAIPAVSQAATSFHRPAPPLLRGGGLRVVLDPGAAAASGGLLRVQGDAACASPGGDPRALALEWVVDPDRRGAALAPRSADALARLARGCLPPQGFLSRLGREVAGDSAATALRVAVRAQIAPPPRADGLASPPLPTTATLQRAWRHAPLRTAEAVLHLLGLVAFVTALGALAWWIRFRLSPTELDVELRTPGGAPVTAGTVVALSPGRNAPAPELEVAVVHRGGPARPWTHHLALGARALQADVPILPGADAARLVVVSAGGASTEDEGGLRLRGQGSDRGGAPARVALSIPDDVLDLDRAPVGVPLRGGVEVAVELASPTARVRGRRRTFYVPCAITVGRVPADEPGLRVEPLQVYLYRGLRPDPVAPVDAGTRVGSLRIAHRADPRSGARPYGVRLRLALSARLRDETGADAGPVRAALGSRALPAQDTLEVEVDAPEHEIPLYLWPADAAALGARSGTVEIEVGGSWEEFGDGRHTEPRPLASAREGVAWYPVETLYGVAVDFGTSATRLAFLREGMPAERTMGIAVPVELVPEALSQGDGAAAPVELSGELASGVAVDAAGRLRAAGASALIRGRGWEVLSSLKQALMDPAAGATEWQAARQVIDRLGDWVERKEGGGARLELCRWRDGAWQIHPHVVPPPFRYLLLATVPDTFDHQAQARFAACFERWQGRVSVLPLREAEAVVFGALMREPEHQPARTLVVDVGAGTVDYAAVRAAFDGQGVLAELRVEGLAVSRAAGNAYDEALATHLDQRSLAPRRWRETKERWYLDPEGSGRPLSPEAAAFLESPRLRAHLDAAVAVPLDALLGRLAHQEAWKDARFDRVILSGRGSLAAGWKARLVTELRARGRVPDAPEAAWLSWLEPGSPDVRADRLKAAVAEGALALISHNQARIQTSRDILRDHVVLVAQSAAGRFRSELVAAAGEVLSPGGIARRVRVGDWLDAKLVLSSHLPGDNGSGAPADLLWRKGVAGEIDDGAGPAPVVRLGVDIPIVGRPADATHGTVRVEQGGGVSFTWEAS